MLTFEDIIKKPQHILKEALISELIQMGYETQTKKGFLYAKGSLPILLVAHLDTVHKELVKNICYSTDGNIVMSPEGIGGDDRAGIYMILQIIKKYPCHVLFCEDEEIGCVGAHYFAQSDITPEINYIVELDRRGSNDAVFYDCNNQNFTSFVTGFGFKEELGSFSDISVVAPKLKVAAVNISAGYYAEHTQHEYIDLKAMNNNIERVGQMISTSSEKFEYIEFQGNLWDRHIDEDYFGLASWLYDETNGVEMESLMPLPDSAHIKKMGKMEECNGQYFIDKTGNVYEYFNELCVAVKAKGCEALSENCMPIKFKKKDAFDIEIVPIESLFDNYDIYSFASNDASQS